MQHQSCDGEGPENQRGQKSICAAGVMNGMSKAWLNCSVAAA